jgi:3-oxoacyl-[acyl-carrier protein] reductase
MFEGKVAIVTGSARGIGRATAELLVAGGASVVIADVDRDAALTTANELGGETAVWSGDLVADGATEELVATAIERWDRLDIVVNNAGYYLDKPVHKFSDDDFRAMVDIHAFVPFRLLRAAAPYLREPAKAELAEGREVFRKVVNVSSAAAYGNPGQAGYSTGKAGVIGLTKTVAREWAPLRICVNAVAFGLIGTRLTEAKSDDTVIELGERRAHVGIPKAALADLAAMVPMGRPGTPQEAAGAIAFLCSPWSDYVTGQVINVAGGMPIGMSS